MSFSVRRVCFESAVDRRSDVCILIYVYFCARVNASVLTQLGGYLSLVGYKELGGLLRYLSDHS